MMILRKVAYSFSGGPLSEWDKFWPVNNKNYVADTIIMDAEMKENILKIHNVKINE